MFSLFDYFFFIDINETQHVLQIFHIKALRGSKDIISSFSWKAFIVKKLQEVKSFVDNNSDFKKSKVIGMNTLTININLPENI